MIARCANGAATLPHRFHIEESNLFGERTKTSLVGLVDRIRVEFHDD